MAYDVSNFLDKVIQYDRDLSCTPEEAMTKYYMSQMYVTKKQLVCDTDKASVILSPGKMQWTIGKVKATSGIKGVGKFFSSKVTGEYEGPGLVVCEPTYKHIVLMDLDEWGGEGLFNTCLAGHGVVALECRCPEEELIEITLNNDTIRIDGNYAIAWSEDLRFTVEKSGKSLLGSAVSGEGFVNVYSGTGRVLLMPQV